MYVYIAEAKLLHCTQRSGEIVMFSDHGRSSSDFCQLTFALSSLSKYNTGEIKVSFIFKGSEWKKF